MLYVFCVCLSYTVLSVYCCLVVIYWERSDLLALLYVSFSCGFVSFPYGVQGKVWNLNVSVPELCLLPYLN